LVWRAGAGELLGLLQAAAEHQEGISACLFTAVAGRPCGRNLLGTWGTRLASAWAQAPVGVLPGLEGRPRPVGAALVCDPLPESGPQGGSTEGESPTRLVTCSRLPGCMSARTRCLGRN
jgi:hypothetical protein